MEQKDKDLLLQDLSGRLPYGVMLNIEDICDKYNDKLFCLSLNHGNSLYINGLCVDNNGYDCYATIKPYLFPLSSMTQEQERNLNLYLRLDKEPIMRTVKEIDWFNKNHFDYRNLIERNLAIDCTNLNIY